MSAEKQTGTSPLGRSAWSEAEARGFEPRMGVNPNRISSPFAHPEAVTRPANCPQSSQVKPDLPRKATEGGALLSNPGCAANVQPRSAIRGIDRTIAEGRVAGAYVDLTTSTWTDLPLREFVSIRVLREALPGIAREDLDDVLTGLYEQQVINLIPRSDQQALTDADRAAAVRCGGEDKHLLAWVTQ